AELQGTVERLRRTEAQLVQSEKMRALGQFVAGIAHELNNPIGFVTGNLEHLRRATDALGQMLAAYADAPLTAPVAAELAARRRVARRPAQHAAGLRRGCAPRWRDRRRPARVRAR